VIEDFLDPNGLTIDDFCRYHGGWLFGFVEALRRTGVGSVLFLISRETRRRVERTHEPTGAPVVVLPSPHAYRGMGRLMVSPYARNASDSFGLRGAARVVGPLLEPVRELAPYVATPVQRLVRELRRYNCAALVCQEYEFPRFDVCVATTRRHGIPCFGAFQGGDYRRWRLERLIRPWAMRACDGLIVGPAEERSRLASVYGIDPSHVHSIPNPIDSDRFVPGHRDRARELLGIPIEAGVVAWHGRVDRWKKGVDVLLEAWVALRARKWSRPLRLLLIGDGPDRASVREQIDADSLGDVIFQDRFIHETDELALLLSAADVYAFPSRHEGFPVAPLEAMACGIPIVAADVSGIRDILPRGELDGGIVVARESSDRLAAALERLLREPGEARALGDRARLRAVEGFSLDAVGRALRVTLVPETPDRA
jgi:glycosyltransferase involved in cell wall biosynthesis